MCAVYIFLFSIDDRHITLVPSAFVSFTAVWSDQLRDLSRTGAQSFLSQQLNPLLASPESSLRPLHHHAVFTCSLLKYNPLVIIHIANTALAHPRPVVHVHQGRARRCRLQRLATQVRPTLDVCVSRMETPLLCHRRPHRVRLQVHQIHCTCARALFNYR